MEKQHKKIQEALLSGNDDSIAYAVSEVAKIGDITFLPYLIQGLHNTTDEKIKKKISAMLAEIKSRNESEPIIKAIRGNKHSDDLPWLLSACWESGIDYCPEISLFVDILTQNVLMIALEAHTVIMNLTGKITEEECLRETQKIQNAILKETDNHKKILLQDVIEFLPSIVRMT